MIPHKETVSPSQLSSGANTSFYSQVGFITKDTTNVIYEGSAKIDEDIESVISIM